MSATQTPKTCTRCHGTGNLPGITLDGGRCWGCLGAGTREAQKAAKAWATIKSIRVNKTDITLAERDGIYRVAVTTDITAEVERFATLDEAKAFANKAYKEMTK